MRIKLRPNFSDMAFPSNLAMRGLSRKDECREQIFSGYPKSSVHWLDRKLRE
jgi:hypothetical protein